MIEDTLVNTNRITQRMHEGHTYDCACQMVLKDKECKCKVRITQANDAIAQDNLDAIRENGE